MWVIGYSQGLKASLSLTGCIFQQGEDKAIKEAFVCEMLTLVLMCIARSQCCTRVVGLLGSNINERRNKAVCEMLMLVLMCITRSQCCTKVVGLLGSNIDEKSVFSACY